MYSPSLFVCRQRAVMPVRELSDLIDASPATLRRDLAKLAETRLSIGGEVHGELAVNVVVDSNAP